MTTTRPLFATVQQQAASLGVAAVMTLAVLAGLGQLADGYHADAAQQQAAATPTTTVAVQQVVVVGKRARA